MNKAELIRRVAERKNISEQKAYQYVTAALDTVRVVLSEGKKIEIGGFGKFLVIRNSDGDRIPVFIAGKTLLNILNK